MAIAFAKYSYRKRRLRYKAEKETANQSGQCGTSRPRSFDLYQNSCRKLEVDYV